MRGSTDPQLAMLPSLSTEGLIPADHPIRKMRVVVDAVLAELDPVFDEMYTTSGRRSAPREQLSKSTVVMAMYSIRSERAFCERLNYDLSFKSFLDMRIDQAAFDATTFAKNRTRGCWTTMLRTSSSPPWSARPSCAATSRRITSPSTAPCSTRGHRTGRSNPRTGHRRNRRLAATSKCSGTARSARVTPTPPRPIRRPGCIASRTTPWRRFATPGTC